MPTLIVQQPGHRIGGRIPWRVLIGRLTTNGIALADSSVSRLHAWVATTPQDDRKHYVADTGSLTGTFVNDKPINKRQDLVDGDVIRVGKVEIAYAAADALPPDVQEVNLAGSPPIANVNEAGVLFDCVCGAPVWYKATAIGHAHHCRHCGRAVRIPDRSGVVAHEVDAPEVVEPGMPPPPSAYVASAIPSALAPPPPPDGPPPSIDDLMSLHAEGTPAAVAPHGDEHGLGEMYDLAQADELLPAPDEHGLTDVAHGVGGEMGHDEPLHLELAPPEPGELPFELDEHATVGPVEQPTAHSEAALPVTEQELERSPADGAFEPASVAHEAAASSVEMEELEPQEAAWAAPTGSAAAAEPVAEPTVCSVCHTPIVEGEETTQCPSCGLTFHAGCWQENLGCSAYGCPQVGALKAQEPEVAPPSPPGDFEDEPTGRGAPSSVAAAGRAMADRAAAAAVATEPAGFPWEFLFLFGSVVGIILGLWSYGVPSLVATLGTLIYLLTMQDSRKRRPVAIVALLLCVIGIGAGLYFSKSYFGRWPPIGPWAGPTRPGGRS